MKKLVFAVKTNLNRPPRIHVQSADKKTTYGSFQANDCAQFDNWEQLSPEEAIELRQYMKNLNAIERYFSTKALNESKDFRIRLPDSFIKAINEISMLCLDETVSIDIYDAIISTSIQHIKTVTARLPEDKKQKALEILTRLEISENKKIDITAKVEAIFSELLSLHNKAEKLHQKAISLFNKDKSIAPKTIEEIANGGLSTSRWLVTCAIDLLLDEKPKILEKMLSDEDFQFLWWNPLMKAGFTKESLSERLSILTHADSVTKFESFKMQEP